MLSWTWSQQTSPSRPSALRKPPSGQSLEASYLILSHANLRLPSEAILQGSAVVQPVADQHFWRLTIFAIRIDDLADLRRAQGLRYQEYMRARGLTADLVIVNEQSSSHVQDLQQAIDYLCENSRLRGSELGPRQHIFAVRRDLMDEPIPSHALALARVVLHTRNGTISDQIERVKPPRFQARNS